MQRGKWMSLVLFLAPATVIYGVLVAWPNVSALYVSLLEWDGYTGESSFVGLANFARLLTAAPVGGDAQQGLGSGVLIAVGVSLGLLCGAIVAHLRARPGRGGPGPAARVLPGALLAVFGVSVACTLWYLASQGRGDSSLWVALKNNLFLTIVPGVLVLTLALVVAHLTNLPLPGMGLMRATYFFPNLMSGLVVGVLWLFLYNPNMGLFGPLLRALAWCLGTAGFSNRAAEVVAIAENGAMAQSTFIYALVPLLVWFMTGFYVVLLSAAMKNIPVGLYEAARIDGASELQMFFRVTLPLIRETLLVAFIFIVISGMRVFELIWVLSMQYVPPKHEVMATYMYQKAFVDGDFGYGSAVSVVLFAIILGIAVVLRGLLRRDVDEF